MALSSALLVLILMGVQGFQGDADLYSPSKLYPTSGLASLTPARVEQFGPRSDCEFIKGFRCGDAGTPRSLAIPLSRSRVTEECHTAAYTNSVFTRLELRF